MERFFLIQILQNFHNSLKFSSPLWILFKGFFHSLSNEFAKNDILSDFKKPPKCHYSLSIKENTYFPTPHMNNEMLHWFQIFSINFKALII